MSGDILWASVSRALLAPVLVQAAGSMWACGWMGGESGARVYHVARFVQHHKRATKNTQLRVTRQKNSRCSPERPRRIRARAFGRQGRERRGGGGRLQGRARRRR